MEWRIFFIGPMSRPMDQHLPRLRHLLINWLVQKRGYKVERRGSKTVVKGDDRITLAIPQDDFLPTGAIPHSVFHQIDSADLIFADLSGGRSAVVYELAMAHALGVYTALIGNQLEGELNFYLKQYKLLGVDLSDKKYDKKDALPPAEVGAAIDHWLKIRFQVSHADNPLSNFYGAPLYDISAASGLAAGFFFNFARPILMRGKLLPNAALNEPKARPEEITGLIILKPDRLTEKVSSIESRLSRVLEDHFGESAVRSAAKEKLVVDVDQGTRTVFHSVHRYVIDIPRTMFSLEQCYRLQRISRTSPSADEESQERLSINMQRVLIERFFDDLRERVRLDYEVSIDKYHVGTIEEIPWIIETGVSRLANGEAPREWKLAQQRHKKKAKPRKK